MKETHRILTSVDGAHDNVIVMKPPMCFGQSDVDVFIACFDECLTAVHAMDLTGAKHTPT
jgi:4-aminobutyrate aminotransferase-like enzyme